MTDVSGNVAASEPTTFEGVLGCIMLAVPSAMVLGYLFGQWGAYAGVLIWAVICFVGVFFPNIGNDPVDTSAATKVEPTTSLLERTCHDSVLLSNFFHGPFFCRGIRFSPETAIQIAASYNRNALPLSSYPNEANCIFRDVVTGLVFRIEVNHYTRNVSWINDPDELFELIADIGVDVRDFDEVEIDRCRFVPGPITRELIKASRGSEPITDEQWERITKRR